MSKKNIIWIQFTSLSVCRHLLPIAMLLTMMQHLLLSKRMQESFWLLFRRKRFLHYSKTICYPLSAFSLPAGLWWKWLRIRSFFHRKCMQKWQAEAKHFCLSVRKCTMKQYINQIYSKLMINGDTRTKRKQLAELISSINKSATWFGYDTSGST